MTMDPRASGLDTRIAGLSPTKRALLEMRLKKQSEAAAAAQIISRRAADGPVPLSFAQQRLWFLDQLEPGSASYNILRAIRAQGVLDVEALQQTLEEIVRRHEPLRTRFGTVDGRPGQVIVESETVPLPVIDLSGLPEAEREAEALRLAAEEARRPFDLKLGPLFRAGVVRLSDREHILLFGMHHIVSDGWSAGILFRELGILYEAFAAGRLPSLPDLPIQYADYAIWQREWLQGEELERQLGYWKRQLAGAPAMLELPTDRPRPLVQTVQGAQSSIVLSRAVSEGLKELSRRENVTLFMTLLAAFQTLLSRYSGQDDVVVGSPIANRVRVQTEGLIGFFSNTLVLRTDLSGDPSFCELLRRVREVALGAYAHQDLPFEKLVEDLQPERSRSHTPLFQVMFVLQNAPHQALELSGLTLSWLKVDRGTSKFDLTLFISEGPDGIRGNLEYSTDLFDTATIERMLGHFHVMLEGIVADPDQRLSRLPILTDAERHELLVAWNDTQVDLAQERPINELFEAQVERSPEAVAVAFGLERLTYRELNARANRTAHYLRKLGVGPDVLVGLCVERSLEMVVGLLGILKAGGAYVPLDPAYPPDRLALILEDARAPVLLTLRRLAGTLPGTESEVVLLDADWPKIALESEENLAGLNEPGNLAYIIYTSGSTGVAKGVAMPHGPLLNLISWQIHSSSRSEPMRTLQFTSLNFDVSFQEIFSTWCSGGTLVLLSEEVRREIPRMLRVLEDESIERIFLPFVALQQLAEAADRDGLTAPHLRQVITAGEQLEITPQIAKLFEKLGQCTLENQYGPSETHVVSAFTLSGPPDQWPPLPPIGRPIANTHLYVLDSALRPVPVGVSGDLYIGGVSLARGYFNKPELTAERFVVRPLGGGPGERVYKTGDLARFLPDGNIVFLGRSDHQVKIRGYRVEPEEVEVVLRRHPTVREAAVVVREDSSGGKRLVAYVVPNTEDASTPQASASSEWRMFLGELLPEYMVPSVFVTLDALPLTPSGKIDRKALPAPNQAAAGSTVAMAARDPLESQLVQIWEQLLGVQPIGVRDSFFDLGGHSLLAVRLVDQIERECGVRIPLTTLYAGATIEHLASTLLEQNAEYFHTPLIEVQKGAGKRPFFFLHGDLFGGGFYCRNLARGLGEDQPFYALQPHGLDGQEMPPSIELMALSHLKVLRAYQPHGPYLLGGFCNGALTAFEMARLLEEQGEKVDLLVLIHASARNTRFRALRRVIASSGYLAGLNAGQQLKLFVTLRSFMNHFGRQSPVERIRFLSAKVQTTRRVLANKLASRSTRGDAPQDSRPGELPSHAFADRFRYFEDLYTDYCTAVKGFIPRPYKGRVSLYWPEELSENVFASQVPHWRKVASEVDIHIVPGGHLSCITKHVDALAEQVKVCLDQVQGNG